MRATGERPRLRAVSGGAGDLDSATLGSRPASGASTARSPRSRRRASRASGCRSTAAAAPAIIFQRDTTIAVPPGWSAVATAAGPMMLSADPAAGAGRRRSAGSSGDERRGRIDPITAAVIGGSLASIAVDMGYRLARMSYSSIIRESEDFGCAICDHEGRQLCEATQSTPLQSGPIPGYLAGIRRRFEEVGDVWRPGDVVVHNHPYYGASHQPDVAFCVPAFADGELVGFSVTTAHHLDLGALSPGSCGIVDATNAFAEGLLLNAVKVEDGGRRVESAWRIIADNTRSRTSSSATWRPRSRPRSSARRATASSSPSTASPPCGRPRAA